MTKETKLRAKLDRQIAKGIPDAHITLAKLLRMNEPACEMDTFWANREILLPSDALWDADEGLAAMARRDQCGRV